MFTIALLGYSGSGKTTLAALLSGRERESFDPAKPAAHTLKFRDKRLLEIAGLIKPEKVSGPEVTILDFKGTARSRDQEEKVWDAASRADLLVPVINGFLPDAEPEKDLASLVLEMIFRDTVRLTALREKQAPASGNDQKQCPDPARDALLERALQCLEKEAPLHTQAWDREAHTGLESLGLISLRKMMALCNGEAPGAAISETAGNLRVPLVVINLAIAGQDADPFWRTAFAAAGLLTFYTIEGKEARAWLVPAGTSAREAAGKIHTDMGRRFIRAEVVNAADFTRLGSRAACRAEGLLHSEGREYPVTDGEILKFQFGR